MVEEEGRGGRSMDGRRAGGVGEATGSGGEMKIAGWKT